MDQVCMNFLNNIRYSYAYNINRIEKCKKLDNSNILRGKNLYFPLFL